MRLRCGGTFNDIYIPKFTAESLRERIGEHLAKLRAGVSK